MTQSIPTKKTIEAIISVFETGSAEGNPGAVALLEDGAGISYGLHQATDRSGSLGLVLAEYELLGGDLSALAPYRAQLDAHASAEVDPRRPPAWVRDCMRVLGEIGSDPVMRRAQEQVFDRVYWTPAVEAWLAMGLRTPLALAVVYDTCIHSGPGAVARMRRLFPELPPASGGDERRWVRAYVSARKRWLADRGGVVAATTYRMDAFTTLIHRGMWALETPFAVRGQVIT